MINRMMNKKAKKLKVKFASFKSYINIFHNTINFIA